jgi:hypothetical protein
MTRFTCLYEELDEKTREYLRQVRTSSGRRMPGIYCGRANPWPVIALISGPIVALVFVAIGFASIKDGWAAAMLQTAGVLLGGWMVLYAFRRFLAGSNPKVAGFFKYFDPHAAYEANGDQVTVTDVTHVTGVTAVGGQGRASVRFEEGGRSLFVMGLTPPQAVLVQDYYAAMDWIITRDEAGKSLNAAVLGGASKEYALTEQLPRDYSDMNLEVESVPTAPEKVRSAGPRVLWYLFIIGCSVATYCFFAAVDKPVRDASAFAGSDTPPALRAYLLDDRNTAHRAEAEQKLVALYKTKADAARNNPNADPVLREGMAKLIESLQGPEPPVVSIRVTNAADTGTKLADFELKNLQEQIGDGISQAVGNEYIRFLVFEPAPGENPHLDVVVTAIPSPTGLKVECEISIRLKPDGEVIANQTMGNSPNGPQATPGGTVTAAAQTTALTALVGQVIGSPAMPLPDADDGDGE